MKEKPWTMPEWMEPYRKFIGGHGGNSVEDLIERLDTEKHLSKTNSIVFAIALQVEAQVHMLERLRAGGVL